MAEALGAEASSWIERLARAGFVAKALLYATVGVLAASAALGLGGAAPGGATDTRGAMATVLGAPFGRALLVAMAVALFGYAAWRIVEAIVDPEHRGRGARGLAIRGSFLARGVLHAALGVSALRFTTGRSGQEGGGDRPREAARAAFEMPAGEWLVWLAAAAVAGYGLYQLYRAAASKLSKRLDTGEMSAEAGRWVIAVSRFGIAARGVVFLSVGWLFVRAASRHDPGQAGGIADALRTLRDLGRWPFAAIAVGLIAYGGYELLNARYRRIRT